MNTLKFDFVFLGQSILKYQVPLDIFTTINQIYEQNFYNLAPANGQLVGCLLYTSPSPRDGLLSRMPSSA